MGCFRAEIEVTPGYEDTPFELKIELLFSEMMATQLLSCGPFPLEKWEEVAFNLEEIEPLALVSSKVLKLNSLA